MKMGSLHVWKGNLYQFESNQAKIVSLLNINIKVHQTRYSLLVMASLSSLYSFSLAPTWRDSLETPVQRATYQAYRTVLNVPSHGQHS